MEDLLPITLTCSCGKRLKTADENAGRQGKCPQCGAVLSFPFPEPPTQFDPEMPSGDLPAPWPDTAAKLGEILDENSYPPANKGPLPGDLTLPAIQHPGEEHLAIFGQIRETMGLMLETIRSNALGGGGGERETREYKVLTQKDKWFSGKFDPERVEGALNAYAKQGWTMKGVATASVPGFGGPRDEIIIVMER